MKTILAHNATIELSLIGAGLYTAAKGKNFPSHLHHEWEIVYYRSGFIECPVGKELYKSRPGLVLVTPPGIPHSETALTAYACYYLNLKIDGLLHRPHLCFDDQERNLERLIKAIVQEWHGWAADREEMLGLLLKQLGLCLKRSFSNEQVSEGEKTMTIATQLIEQQYTSPLTINKIAEQIGVSSAYLRMLFARYKEDSPLAYLQSLRLRHALQLISNSNLSLNAIAELSGYNSASHLSRHIKRETGTSPGKFRATPTILQD